MNKTMLAIVILLIGVVVAAAIVTNDEVDLGHSDDPDVVDPGDGPLDDADGLFVEWPKVNDPAMGKLEIKEYDRPNITFVAVPNQGFAFIGWEDSDGTTVSNSDTITIDMNALEDYTAVFGTFENVINTYEWDMPVFSGDSIVSYAPMSYVTTVSGADYMSHRGNEDYPRYASSQDYVPSALVIADSEVLKVAEYLDGMTEGMTDLQKGIVVMCFVQDAITYQTDLVHYGVNEYWATPVETMYSGLGDCEDGAILYVAVASVMGLDSGLVAFDDPRAGHMGAAIAVDEDVTGTTFTIDGRTYVYVETADSGSRVNIGDLMTPYHIGNGLWTHLIYDSEEGTFTSTEPVRISGAFDGFGSVVYGDGHVYGDEFSNPPAIEMSVGDGFDYHAETSLRSEITATGNGLASEGGFLVWDPETDTLSGTADLEGDYIVILEAVWNQGELSQTAYQTIVFHVGTGSDVVYDKELVYGSSGWEVLGSVVEDDSEPETTSESDDTDWTPIYIAFGLAAILAVLMVGRRLV